MRLRWQKIGVVLSVVRAIGIITLCTVAVRQDVNNAEHTEWQYAQNTCEIDTREAAIAHKQFDRSCSVEATNAEQAGRQNYWSNIGAGYYVFIGLVALLPILASWAAAYALASVAGWVRLKPLKT